MKEMLVFQWFCKIIRWSIIDVERLNAAT